MIAFKHINLKYNQLLYNIMHNGYEYEDPNRKGVIRKQISHHIIEHDFIHGFPIITEKKSFPKMARIELELFMRGETDIREYWKRGLEFWTADWKRWVKENNLKGEEKYFMKNIYPTFLPEQLKGLIETLRTNPMATKKIVTMLFPDTHNNTTLSPCHWSFEALVEPIKVGYGLRIKFYMGSVDTFLGLPMNIQYYSFLCVWLAKICGMEAIGVIADLTNVHLYDNSWHEVHKLLGNSTWDKYELTKVSYNGSCEGTHPLADNFVIENYNYKGDYIPVEMLTYSK